eukprot:TRINITY_DN36770_c0_g1_i1.p1 TRINITY_DN36770_c0_g1~~TRINITY_DN36770_c0_g1_i1.p1  ORF type:complete len:313 (-),score=43.12 TRINITY_DN36770_c0_g1_i1:80-1018(-)
MLWTFAALIIFASGVSLALGVKATVRNSAKEIEKETDRHHGGGQKHGKLTEAPAWYVNRDGRERLILNSNSDPSTECHDTVWWLHFPKAGSSFVNSVKSCKWSPMRADTNHESLPVDASDELLKSVVAIFRQPEERLMSAFTWIRKLGKDPRLKKARFTLECAEDWGWTMAVSVPAKQAIFDGQSAAQFAGRFGGCITNMIVGRGCMSAHKPTQEEQLEAIRRSSLFKFVGLITEWELSVCLFNFLTSERRFMKKSQLIHFRPTEGANRTAYNTEGIPKDLSDNAVWKAAETRFWQDVKRHGISHESCKLEE